MAFPSVATTSISNGFGTAVTSTHPTGTTTGDLLILVNARASATTTTWPGGWATLLTNSANGSAFEVGYRWWQSGDTAPALTLGASSIWANRMFRVSGADTATNPECTTMTTGTSVSPDPGSLNPAGWGTEDTLWIAVCSYAGAADPSAYPTSYTDNLATRWSGSQPSLASATRQLNAASEDPGAFTIASAAWRAATIGIRPAGAPPSYSPANLMPFFV